MINYIGKTIYLGIDVHKNTYSVTAVCEGFIVKHTTLDASPKALVKYCKQSFKGATIKSAYEAGFCGFVLHRYLISQDIQNIVVNPASIEVESRNCKKNDKRDSRKIAEQLSAGRLRSIYIPTLEAENRRYISRLREVFVKQRIRTANQLKGLLNLNGLADGVKKVSNKFITELAILELDENVKFCLIQLAKTWLYFTKGIKEIEEKLKIMTPKEEEIYNSYRKIKGFGPKISKILVHELGDTMQFSNEEKLFSFCGLTPSERSSGEHKRLGNITRQGRPILRKLLVQAAWVAIRKDLYFSEYYDRLSAKKGSGKAIIAVARKLIGRARCAIKKKETFLALKAEDKVDLQEDFCCGLVVGSCGVIKE
jgi:transposase